MCFKTLPHSTSVATPWSHTLGVANSHNIPLDVAEDIKAKEGWELIAHTMNPSADRYLNYLILHNYLTGILKVFYYVDGNPSGNNAGFWKIEFSGAQRMLNFADEIADPLTYGGSRKSMIVSNLIKDSHKGFTKGWNCFQIELAYDPNFTTGTMSISAYNCNTQSVNMEGVFSASHTGTIVSQSSNSSTGFDSKGLATLIGDAADKWLEKQKEDGNINSSPSTRGISTTQLAQAVKAFSSIVGKKNDSSTNYDIQLKTEGQITLKGNITSVAASIVAPINLSCSVVQVGALGCWNLRTSPIVYFSPAAYYSFTRDLYNYYYECDPGFSRVGLNSVRNPKATSKATLVSSSSSFDVISYYQSLYDPSHYFPTLSAEYNNFNAGTLGNGSVQLDNKMDIVYDGTLENNQIRITKYYGRLSLQFITDAVLDQFGDPKGRIDIRTAYFTPNTIGFKSPRRFVRIKNEERFLVNGEYTTIVNSKTFYPSYEWDN